VYAYLRERGVHPELAEVRVLLQAPFGGHCLEVHLAHPGRPAVGPVLQARKSLLDPPLQRPVDGSGADPKS
jgi:hypothetical protein